MSIRAIDKRAPLSRQKVHRWDKLKKRFVYYRALCGAVTAGPGDLSTHVAADVPACSLCLRVENKRQSEK